MLLLWFVGVLCNGVCTMAIYTCATPRRCVIWRLYCGSGLVTAYDEWGRDGCEELQQHACNFERNHA